MAVSSARLLASRRTLTLHSFCAIAPLFDGYCTVLECARSERGQHGGERHRRRGVEGSRAQRGRSYGAAAPPPQRGATDEMRAKKGGGCWRPSPVAAEHRGMQPPQGCQDELRQCNRTGAGAGKSKRKRHRPRRAGRAAPGAHSKLDGSWACWACCGDGDCGGGICCCRGCCGCCCWEGGGPRPRPRPLPPPYPLPPL